MARKTGSRSADASVAASSAPSRSRSTSGPANAFWTETCWSSAKPISSAIGSEAISALASSDSVKYRRSGTASRCYLDGSLGPDASARARRAARGEQQLCSSRGCRRRSTGVTAARWNGLAEQPAQVGDVAVPAGCACSRHIGMELSAALLFISVEFWLAVGGACLGSSGPVVHLLADPAPHRADHHVHVHVDGGHEHHLGPRRGRRLR